MKLIHIYIFLFMLMPLQSVQAQPVRGAQEQILIDLLTSKAWRIQNGSEIVALRFEESQSGNELLVRSCYKYSRVLDANGTIRPVCEAEYSGRLIFADAQSLLPNAYYAFLGHLPSRHSWLGYDFKVEIGLNSSSFSTPLMDWGGKRFVLRPL